MNTNWVWLPKIALNVFLCFFCEPILIFWNVIKFLLVYYEVLHSLSVTPVIQAQMLPTFDLQNMLQNYVTAPKPKNALDICDKAWRQCFLFHYVHFVIFLWALYQMPNRSLASDFDTLNPNSKFPPCLMKSEWHREKPVTKIQQMVFASNDLEYVLVGNICQNFQLLGTACMKLLKWLHFLFFQIYLDS